MNQTPDVPDWLTWLVGIATLFGAVLTYLRRVFVTNRELQKILEKQEEQRERSRLVLHKENIANFRTLFERLGKLEQSQARTEGLLSGRYPRLDR